MGAFFLYLAYNYIIGVMGNAFNSLFLVWTAIFSLGLFGLAAVLMEIVRYINTFRLSHDKQWIFDGGIQEFRY